VRFVKLEIDEQTWQRIRTKLKDVEALKVLREVANHVIERLKSRIDEIQSSREKISFLSERRVFLTINVGRTDLRIYFEPVSGALFSKNEKFAVDKVSFWETSFQKSSGKYRALTAWVSKQEHLPGIKTLIDRIPTSR
jgi:hypothetical protein